MAILLNIDLGELIDEDEQLYALAHVANIACGGHAGNDASMRRSLALCRYHGTQAGAHPSYLDRESFGRRALNVSAASLGKEVEAQCVRLAAHARELSVMVNWVKPHGALYHAADDDGFLATAVVEGAMNALGSGVTVIGPPNGALADAASRLGVRFAREGFADRKLRKTASGRVTLVPRSEPGAVIEKPAAARARALEIALGGAADTICVHGDTPSAVLIAREVRQALDRLNKRA